MKTTNFREHSIILSSYLMAFRKFIFVTLFTLSCLFVDGQSKDSLQIMKATENFLKAFTSFDWPTFRNAFASDATIFFPVWEQRIRRIGQKEIDSTWLEIFPEFIDSTIRFDLKIVPKDVHLQLFNQTGIVTFHIGSDEYLSRRTFVFSKIKGEWKIVHLHASGLAKPE